MKPRSIPGGQVAAAPAWRAIFLLLLAGACATLMGWKLALLVHESGHFLWPLPVLLAGVA